MTTFILVSLCVMRFHEGGWGTLVVTGAVVAFAFFVQHHYQSARADLKRLDELVPAVELSAFAQTHPAARIERGEAGRVGESRFRVSLSFGEDGQGEGDPCLPLKMKRCAP